MSSISRVIPLFYVRGFEEPFTEGHIQIARMLMKSLFSCGVCSYVFNFRYPVSKADVTRSPQQFYFHRSDVNIPFLQRERALRPNLLGASYSSIMETLLGVRFFYQEKNLGKNCPDAHSVVNVVNCFKHPLFLSRTFLKDPIILHVYRRGEDKTSMRMFIRKAERIIVSSRVVAKHVEETYCVDRKRIEHLSPPVDTELYKPVCLSSEPLCAKEINRRKIEGRKKKILYVGGLSPSNRFPIIPVLTLIRRLVKDFPDLKLIIFSNRNYKNIKSAVALQKEAEKLDVLSNVQVEIKNLSDEAKSDLYRQADLFLFPSAPPYSATEPPIAPMEAMASGLPVVSTRIPSLEEFVVNNVNGLIYSLEDESYSDLTNRMSQLLKDGEMRTKFSIDARKTIVEKVSPTQTGKKLIKIYANI